MTRAIAAATSAATALVLLVAPPHVARAQTPHSVAPGDSSFATVGASRPGRVHVVRLRPGHDLRAQLMHFARAEHLKAAYVASVAGSVRRATLRLSGRTAASEFAGPFEIVSLTGTLSEARSHLHASFSDSTGRTVGGHLVDGCPIFTTAEVVVVEAADLEFFARPDSLSGFVELGVRPRGAEGRE